MVQELELAAPDNAPAAYSVLATDDALPQAMPVIEALRFSGLDVVMHAGGGSFKNQLKKADASGARYALIFGADELAQGVVTVKSLRDGTGAQVQRPLAEVAGWAPTLRA